MPIEFSLLDPTVLIVFYLNYFDKDKSYDMMETIIFLPLTAFIGHMCTCHCEILIVKSQPKVFCLDHQMMMRLEFLIFNSVNFFGRHKKGMKCFVFNRQPTHTKLQRKCNLHSSVSFLFCCVHLGQEKRKDFLHSQKGQIYDDTKILPKFQITLQQQNNLS